MSEKIGEIRRIFARNVKSRRESLGMSREEFAEKTDLSVQSINTIEWGKTWVSDKSLARVAKALGIDAFQLFMPNFVNLSELDNDKVENLLLFWHNTKEAITKLNRDVEEDLKGIIGRSKKKET